MPDGSLATDEERAMLLAAYDTQLRGVAEVQGAVSWDHSGPLWRGLFNDGAFVSYESLEGLGNVEAVDRLIADTVEYFAAIPQVREFEWKTRGHDWPPELDGLLRAHGLEPDEVETVMVGEAKYLAVDVELPDGVTIRRVDQADDRDAVVTEASEVAASIFGHGGSGAEMLERLAGSSAPGGSTGWRARSSRASGAARRCRSGGARASTARSPPPVPGRRSTRESATSTATAR